MRGERRSRWASFQAGQVRCRWRFGRVMVAACLIGFASQGQAWSQDYPGDGETSIEVLGSPPRLHDPFEDPGLGWRRETFEGSLNLIRHDRTDRAAYDLQRSERIAFEGIHGSGFYFSYDLPKIVLDETFVASLHVRANRAGVQLAARVILPEDADPETGQPNYVVVGVDMPGSRYTEVDRWQRLVLGDLREDIRRQARIKRVRSGSPVGLEGAYVDQLVVNVYCGPGATEVFLDNLVVYPVPEDWTPAPRKLEAPSDPGVAGVPMADRKPSVTLSANEVQREDRPWFFLIADAPGLDPEVLYRMGFHGSVEPVDGDPRRAEMARARGLDLMVRLPMDRPEAMIRQAIDYRFRQDVAFWDLGQQLGRSFDPEIRRLELERTREVIAGLRREQRRDPSFPSLTTAEVAGPLVNFSRPPHNLDLIGIAPHGWASMWEPWDARLALQSRRDETALSNPGGPFWARVEASPDPEVMRAIWGQDVPPAWGYPQVQPEQIRLAYYEAVSAGYRGLIVAAGPELARPSGRAQMIELMLLNSEIRLLEPILASDGGGQIQVRRVFPNPMLPRPSGEIVSETQVMAQPAADATIRASALGTADHRTQLVLITDYAAGAQWQPPQMARRAVKVRVPGVPPNALAYRISLGGLVSLDRERVAGGIEVLLADLDPTTLVLVSTDRGLLKRIHDAVMLYRHETVALAIEQARLQIDWVTEVQGRLQLYVPPDLQTRLLLDRARESLAEAEERQSAEQYRTAYHAARRVGRPLRILMRDTWDKAVAALRQNASQATAVDAQGRTRPDSNEASRRVDPIAIPPLLAYNTLPRAYYWIGNAGRVFGPSLVGGGDFDTFDDLLANGWTEEGYVDPNWPSEIRIGQDLRDGGGALRLLVEPDPNLDEEQRALLVAPESRHPTAAVRTPQIAVASPGQPRSIDQPLAVGDLIRIRVLVRMETRQTPGHAGLIVRDSIGGERLQWRSSQPVGDWTEVVLYRRVPDTEPVSVLLGLAGRGEAQFDRLRIEQLVISDGPLAEAEPASRPRR